MRRFVFGERSCFYKALSFLWIFYSFHNDDWEIKKLKPAPALTFCVKTLFTIYGILFKNSEYLKQVRVKCDHANSWSHFELRFLCIKKQKKILSVIQ